MAVRKSSDRGASPAGPARVRACVVALRLRGFDQLSAQLEPRRVVALLQEFLGAMADVAVAHRAAIDAVRGDGVLLSYGVPARRRDDPMRAVRAAAALQRGALALRNRWLAAGENRAATLGLAVGVAAGDVLVADLRGGGGRPDTLVGEPVGRAERLCAAARDGETLVDEAIYAAAGPRLDGELTFTPRALAGRGREARGVYRARPRRAGLLIVPRRAEAATPLAGWAAKRVSQRSTVRTP